MNLDRFFKPDSIAIYGVSTNPEKISSILFYNLISSEFEGKLYPINPKYDKINGYKCYKTASEIKDKVDLAIMAIPAQFVLEVLDDCHRKGIKSLIIVSAGFAEANEEGKILEEKMIFTAQKYGIDIFGPNSLGLIVTESKLNASFAAANALDGGIALISQSGAVCTAFLDLANTLDLGFSHLLSIGNKSMINENDFLEYFLKDKSAKVIGGYLEGFKDGSKFIKLKNELGIHKPITIMSPGSTEAAKVAIKSHTGSLSSSHEIINTALSKYGIFLTENLSEMFNLIMGFEWVNALPKGNRVGIITNAGGVGILATDALVESGLEIAQLSEETAAALAKVLPAEVHARNPVDVIGDAKSDRYENALNILAEAEEVDSILVLLTPQLVTEIEDTAKLLNALIKNFDKPIIPVFLGGEYIESGVKRMHNNKVLCYTDLNIAVYVLDKITEYADFLKKNEEQKIKNLAVKPRDTLKKYATSELTPLSEEVVLEIIEKFDLDLPKSFLVDSPLEAVKYAERIGYPVVIKATTADIVHKTDVKAIYLNIKNRDELLKFATKLQRDIIKFSKKSHVSFLLQEQIKSDLEVFIGAKRDDNFGTVILFGTGGIYTEVYKDISQRMIPLTKSDFEEQINATKVSKIIDGFRGKPKLAKNKLIQTLMSIQKLMQTYPEISEIDINPVMMSESRCVLPDVKIFVKSKE